jgi:hypothetical protein
MTGRSSLIQRLSTGRLVLLVGVRGTSFYWSLPLIMVGSADTLRYAEGEMQVDEQHRLLGGTRYAACG